MSVSSASADSVIATAAAAAARSRREAGSLIDIPDDEAPPGSYRLRRISQGSTTVLEAHAVTSVAVGVRERQ
jgi:hypothetical protein